MVETPMVQGPLDAYAPAFVALEEVGLTIALVPQPAQINLRGQAKVLATPVAETCAVLSLAHLVNAATTNGTWCSLGLGPDEWLLVGPPGVASRTAADLAAKLADHHVSVVDVTANRVALDIAGPIAPALFASLTSLDMATLGPGRCAQTMLAKTQVILQSGPNPQSVRVFVRSSFARYLADVIIDAAPLLGAP